MHDVKGQLFVRKNNSGEYYYIRLMAFFQTTWVSRHQKHKPLWILLEQEMKGWQHLASAGPYAIICTSLQTDNHASTSTIQFFTGRMPFLPPNQRCQSTEGKRQSIEGKDIVYKESLR